MCNRRLNSTDVGDEALNWGDEEWVCFIDLFYIFLPHVSSKLTYNCGLFFFFFHIAKLGGVYVCSG